MKESLNVLNALTSMHCTVFQLLLICDESYCGPHVNIEGEHNMALHHNLTDLSSERLSCLNAVGPVCVHNY